jgi:hypothetical protein
MTDTRVPDEAVRALIERLRQYQVQRYNGDDVFPRFSLYRPPIAIEAADTLEAFLSPQAGEALGWWLKIDENPLDPQEVFIDRLDCEEYAVKQRMTYPNSTYVVLPLYASSSSPSIERGEPTEDDLKPIADLYGNEIADRFKLDDWRKGICLIVLQAIQHGFRALVSPRPIGDEKARVKVKALTWRNEDGDRLAPSVAGNYWLFDEGNGWKLLHGEYLVGIFGSEDIAKIAAQSDYEARINSAIEQDGEANGA